MAKKILFSLILFFLGIGILAAVVFLAAILLIWGAGITVSTDYVPDKSYFESQKQIPPKDWFDLEADLDGKG